jgi:muramoyltetrapeptide carboxypeptidase LdcA involved in peptidoglycan recycling
MPVKASALRPGDTIGIVAPSWCGPARYPHRMEHGIKFLESIGYRIVVSRHAYGNRGSVSGTPEERASDLHELFGDSAVRAIIAAIGGGHSCHLLPFLDWDLIKRNPKIFMGFSDITVLNLSIYTRTGLTTFNGPMVISDFGEDPTPNSYTLDNAWRALCQSNPLGEITPADRWTDEFMYWATEETIAPTRSFCRSPGWTWLKPGMAQGRLVGGCIESLQHLRGTPFWPDFEGTILFLETSEEVPSPSAVDAMLQDYENMGAFGKISGLLIGRPMGYSEARKQELRSIILERTQRYSFPIITDMDFGHTAPTFTLPIGCGAHIDSKERRFSINEAAVCP